MPTDIDILLLTALEDELNAAKTYNDGARDDWQAHTDASGQRSHTRTYLDMRGEPLKVMLAWSGGMAGEATAETAGRLIALHQPRFLAMSGVCAGRKGKVHQGDLIVADPVYRYDDGKTVAGSGKDAEQHQGQLNVFRMDQLWLQRARDYAGSVTKSLGSGRPPNLTTQEHWQEQVSRFG